MSEDPGPDPDLAPPPEGSQNPGPQDQELADLPPLEGSQNPGPDDGLPPAQGSSNPGPSL